MSTLRRMTNEDQLAYKQLCSVCYIYKDTEPAEPKTEDELKRMIGVFDEDNRLLSAMTQHDFTIRFEGHDAHMLGIGGVVSDPAARGQRGVRRMFEEGLPRLCEEGFVFSALHPFSHEFYRKFGYELASVQRGAIFAPSSLKKSYRLADEIIRVLPGEDDHGMAEIYEQYASSRNFAVLRTPEMWKRRRAGFPWDSLKYAYVMKIGGKAVSYWIGQAERDEQGKTLSLLDFAYTCPEGRDAIFAMLRGMNEISRIRMAVPADLLAHFLVEDPHDVQEERSGCGGMFRVMNVEKALEMLPAPAHAGRCVIEVKDLQVPCNNGLFAVEGDGCRLQVKRLEVEAADLRCSINGLTTFVSGLQDFDDCVSIGQGELLREENAGFLRELFVRRKSFLNWAF